MFKKLGIDIDDKKKAIIITVSIALFTILICSNIIKSHAGKRDSMGKAIQEQVKKIVLREDIEKIEKTKGKYAAFFYDNIDQQALRAIISDLASQADADIISIKPLGGESVGSLSKESLDISLRCTYNQLGVLVAKIENLKSMTKVESLSIEGLSVFMGQTMSSEQEQIYSVESDTKLLVSMIVSAYSGRGL
jgi:hypothetical protein